MTTKKVKALFLTGQSHRQSCGLSPAQSNVANIIQQQGASISELNFPYNEQLTDFKLANIVQASVNNAQQFLICYNKRFTQQYSDKLIAQLQDHDKYLILAGSCGLHIFNHLTLPQTLLDKIHIIAYGPVAHKTAATKTQLIQGTQDWISKIFFKQVDLQVPCGHMDYLECELFIDYLKQQTHQLLHAEP